MASEPGFSHLIDSPDLGEVVVEPAALQARVAELGAEITAEARAAADRLIKAAG